ncbi:Crp/Fnr family transcriptional regulator [Flavobacterium sp.]|uniref:Crp/Fnr family transcriptional regulator n=1 Tax=Flavobacterium sp. TaxID=239 RepID=UPI001216D4CC|nr:Crp/Fnr family transcriptional regulator [Flavobacterium sp.]RZJ73066.1 MAG: Crp/Fnr family transcriptional regulator [Flavobacterium sp.]
MHEALLTYIENHSVTPLTETQVAEICAVFVSRHYQKGHYLLHQGDVCRCMGFILKGAVCQYSVDEKGNEITIGLQIENWFAGDRDSYFRETPSIYNVEAWEDCDLLLIHKENFPRLMAIPAFVEMRIKLDENHCIAAQRRLQSQIGASAEKRYEDFLQTSPQLANRFPLRMVASFLGITKETLSRIRRRSLC